jgi:hypothetical protein
MDINALFNWSALHNLLSGSGYKLEFISQKNIYTRCSKAAHILKKFKRAMGGHATDRRYRLAVVCRKD